MHIFLLLKTSIKIRKASQENKGIDHRENLFSIGLQVVATGVAKEVGRIDDAI